MSNHPLTNGAKRGAVLDFIERYTLDHGRAPSVRDIATGCGLTSTSSVMFHLDKLERAGQIARVPDISRGVRLVRPAGCCPTCGSKVRK